MKCSLQCARYKATCLRLLATSEIFLTVCALQSNLLTSFGHEWNIPYSERATKQLAYVFCVDRMRNPFTLNVCVLRLAKFKAICFCVRGISWKQLAYAKSHEWNCAKLVAPVCAGHYNENERQDVLTNTQHEASYWRVVIRALMLVHQVTLVIASIYYCLLLFYTYNLSISDLNLNYHEGTLSLVILLTCMALNHRVIVSVCYFQMTKLLIISVAARTRVYLWLE